MIAKVLWGTGIHRGTVTVTHADLLSPQGVFETDTLLIETRNERVGLGANTTVVNVITGEDGFGFLLRDVRAEYPIWLPRCNAVVTTAQDKRTYEEIVSAILAQKKTNRLEKINLDSEYSFDRAAKETIDLPGPAWLGITRDMRIFEVGLRTKSCGNDTQVYDYIRPMIFDSDCLKNGCKDEWTPLLENPEFCNRETPVFNMMTGRGLGCRHDITRRLEDGFLPILNACNEDQGIHYSMQYFVTQEFSPLDQKHIRGTDVYAAHMMGAGHMFDEKHKQHALEIRDSEIKREEETVLYARVIAENRTDAPAYCFIMAPEVSQWYDYNECKMTHEEDTGFTVSNVTGKVLALCELENGPMPQIEMSALLLPGQKLTFSFKIPHRPISRERAEALSKIRYEDRLNEARAFWRKELAQSSPIHVPEKRIDEMIKAGILHCDIGYFGKNPDGPLDPIIGVYTGIGSESSPGIQFLDAVGMHDMARRAMGFFTEMQHDDGYVQNFGGYMLETGCALWTAGEHFRMTRDLEWVKSVRSFILKGCDYLIKWREKNLTDDLKNGNGYGMNSGKTSDPPDYFHAWQLNGGSYAGLARSAEMLEAIGDTENAKRIGDIAKEWKQNIRESYQIKLTQAPAIPASDGTWYSMVAPWTENNGPMVLYTEGERCFTHGAFTAKDQESSIYLALHEVIDPDEPLCDDIIKFYTDFLTINNTGFSQYYYSPHAYIHALRGEVKPYLQEFYSSFAALADRETYNFWEHPFHASPFKLHEETWFLMRCRWMLALEILQRKELRLLSMIPRAWMKSGECIAIDGMKTYYGALTLRVESDVEHDVMHVSIQIDGTGAFPAIESLTIRLPHPVEGKKALSCTMGNYDPVTETVSLGAFSGSCSFDLLF